MPTDPLDPAVAKLLREQEQVIERLREELAAKDAKTRELQAELATQNLRIKGLLHQLYGVKSEKLDPMQYQLIMEGVQPVAAEPVLVEEEVDEPEKKSRGGGRRPPPGNLPVKVTIIDLPEAERKGLVKIREEVTEQLERAPARHYLHRIIRYVYADPKKEESPKVAALPAQVYPQSGLGTSVIANAAVAKFCDHVPLFRQQRIAGREGVDLPRQKLGRALEAGAHLLQTVESALWQRILQSGYTQVDETEYKLIDPAHKGKTVTGRFWVFHSPAVQAVIARFERGKDHEILLHYFPPAWKGTIQSDAAKQYDAFGSKRPEVRQAGCMAHSRRKWFDAAKGGGEPVAKILLTFGQLYRLEREARQLGLRGEDRAVFRQSRRVPELLSELKERIERARAQPGVLPDDLIGRAATYALNNWAKLTLYAQVGFGQVEIDNNLCENSIRPIVLTRKNALFIGHPDAAWVSNVYISVIGTCRLIGVNPEAYLNWVLPQLAAGTNLSTASGLLPHDYAAGLLVKEPPP
jgi:transposase